MARRLAGTAERLGIAADGSSLILQAFALAMERRRERVEDDHHPDYLHPARNVLILMDDLSETDPSTLAAAALAETRDRKLAVPLEEVSALDAAVADLVAAVPRPGGPSSPDIVELLVTAPRQARLIAVVERLDHARHLHLRERFEWREFHSVSCRAYAAVARQLHPVLAQRWAWWCDNFEARFLGP